MEFNDLVKAFADKYGIAGLDAADGVAALDIDGMSITLIHADSADFMTIYGEIGTPPPDANGPFGKLMLTTNHALAGTDGPVLCMDPDNQSYGTLYRLPLGQAAVESLSEHVDTIVNAVADWKQVIGGFRVVEEESAKSESANESINPLSSSPFIQV